MKKEVTDQILLSSQQREAALFVLALEKPLAERMAFLQAICGKEDALRQRLEALLVAHEQPDTLLATQAEAARPRIKVASMTTALLKLMGNTSPAQPNTR